MQKMMMHICFTAFHETDCKSNKFQSGKALIVSYAVQFFLIEIQGPSCHICLDMHYYCMFSQLTLFLFKLIKSLAFNHRKGYNSHPKLNQYHHLPGLMPEVSKFTLIG